MIHTVKGFSIVNEAEIDIFLEFPCFFYHPIDIGSLISGSSAFSKSSLNIWKFTVHMLLKHGLENFEPYFAREWDDWGASKSLQMVTIAMKLKDPDLLEEKLWPTYIA